VPAPLITLTTDFGTADHYVAAMKGVILGICANAAIVDISHEVPRYSIPGGAWVISQAWRCFPKGTTHVVVVDPGVGSKRRPILAEVDGHRFVAPDNGVLTMVLEAARAPKTREITAARYFRQPVSQTFHGRDIFAPVAARLACGLAASKVGPLLMGPIRLPFGSPLQSGPESWTGTVLHIDRFGNVVTNFSTDRWTDLHSRPFSLRCNRKVISVAAECYEAMKPGRLNLIRGSAGFWEISCNQQDAAVLLGASPGSPIDLRLL